MSNTKKGPEDSRELTESASTITGLALTFRESKHDYRWCDVEDDRADEDIRDIGARRAVE